MPYVRERERDLFKVSGETALTTGQLNFQITTLVDEWLDSNGVNYTNLNAAIGVLECAKLELYRRIAAPYEDKKKEENGDVYTVA